MLRWLILFGGATLVWALDVRPALAADASWPSLDGPFARGTGFYFSPWKIATMWLLFLAWARTTDWVSLDGQKLKVRWSLWNSIVFFVFFVGLLLFWIVPWFFVGLVLLLMAYAGPLIGYVIYRNSKVLATSDKVMTAKHVRRLVARAANSIGIKMAGAEVDPRDLGPDVKFTPKGGGSEREDSVNLLTARQSPGYRPARELIDDSLRQRATHVMLDYTAESVAVRYQVDGAWHDRDPLERESGDFMLTVLKLVAGLNEEDRRSRQGGEFGVQVEKDKYNCKITTQGTQTGERVLIQLETKKVSFNSLEEMGMRPKMQEQLEELTTQPGLFIFSSMPGGGLTTTIDMVLSNMDRYIRNFVEVADAGKGEREIENVQVTTFAGSQGETAAAVLPRLIRTYPDVIVVRDVTDLETLSILCEQAGDNRLILVATRAKEAVEALLRLMMLKIPPADFAAAACAVLNVRLIRRLCEKCKEGYSPSAEVLKQLGLPAGRVETLYRPPTAPIDPKHPDVVCEVCQGIGYYGRTGIFELLTLNDDLRQVLSTAPKLENLRAVARKSKHRSLQEEGVLLVARGVTSIPELCVLKQ